MWTQLKTHTTFEEFAQMHRVSSKNPNIVLVLVSFTTSEEARDLTAAMQGLSITKKVNRQNLIAYLIHEKFLENDRGTHKVVRSSMITHKLNNDKIKFCPKCSLNTTTCSC
jgi:hypothetical protein